MTRIFTARGANRVLAALAWLTLLLCGIAGFLLRGLFDAAAFAPVM